MSQIEELQARITRALDRIGQGVDDFAPGPTQAEFDALLGRAEAAEDALSDTRAELEATRRAAKAELEGALAAVRAEAAEEIARLREAVQPEPDPEPEDGAAGDGLDAAALQEALEDEKIANAQLEERVRVLKQRLSEAEAAKAAPAAVAAPAGLAELDAELHRLRVANEELAASNAALREANAQGVGEPELINRGLEAELAALRAMRAADAAEAQAVLDTLTPLLAEAAEEGAQ